MDSEEKLDLLPACADMLRELRRKPQEEALRLLATWVERADGIGYRRGLSEGLARVPAERRLLADIPISSRGGGIYAGAENQHGPCPTCERCLGGAFCRCDDYDCPCWLKHLKRPLEEPHVP